MRFRAAALSLLLVAAACSSSDKVAGPSNSTKGLATGSMAARINGSSWTATASATGVNHNGIIALAGSDLKQTLGFAVAASGTGTYTTGALSPLNAILTESNGQAWTAALTNGSGTVTITSLTATAVAGTFSFTMVASPGSGSSGARTVTEGTFNVKF